MNDWDQASRYAFRRIDPEGVLRWLLGLLGWMVWEWQDQWLDSQTVPFPGERDRRLDTLATLQRRDRLGPPLAVVVEFLTRARQDVVERLGEYGLQVHRQLPAQRDPLVQYEVAAYVINLTGTLTSGHWSMQPVGLGGLGMTVKVGVVDLQELSAWRLMREAEEGETAAVVLVWLPLCRGGDDPRLVQRWVQRAGQEPEEQRLDLAALVVLFADLAGCGSVWRTALEGWKVERSAWLQEREQRAEARGEARAALRANRTQLLRVLGARLKTRVLPADVVEVVEQQTDPEVMDRWFERAALVESVEQARAALGLSGEGAVQP